MTDEFYPDHLLPVISARQVDYGRFAEIRESVLLDYGQNTARAYWGDLDDVFWWAQAREKDVLELCVKDLRQYVALLRRRKYSESTIRRVTALRKFYDELVARRMKESNPVCRSGDSASAGVASAGIGGRQRVDLIATLSATVVGSASRM